MSQEMEQNKAKSIETDLQTNEDLFTKQIKMHQTSKITQFLNVFYSFIVGLLCAVASRKTVGFPKSFGTLVGLLSYLYNRNASH